MRERLPTEEEFKGWLTDPVTEAVFKHLPRAKVQELQDMWANGNFTMETIEASALKNAEVIGELNAWRTLAALDYSYLVTQLKEEEEPDGNGEWDAGGSSEHEVERD